MKRILKIQFITERDRDFFPEWLYDIVVLSKRFAAVLEQGGETTLVMHVDDKVISLPE